MAINTVTVKKDVSLAMDFQKHLSRKSRKHGTIDHRKHKTRTCKLKWNNIEYHLQTKDDVEHQQVKMFYGMVQFLELQFCCPHTKPYGVCGLGKHYYVHFDPKLVHGKSSIRCIPCECMECFYQNIIYENSLYEITLYEMASTKSSYENTLYVNTACRKTAYTKTANMNTDYTKTAYMKKLI